MPFRIFFRFFKRVHFLTFLRITKQNVPKIAPPKYTKNNIYWTFGEGWGSNSPDLEHSHGLTFWALQIKLLRAGLRKKLKLQKKFRFGNIFLGTGKSKTGKKSIFSNSRRKYISNLDWTFGHKMTQKPRETLRT